MTHHKAEDFSEQEDQSATEGTPQDTTEGKTPKSMIFLGLGLLVVAVITAIVSLVGVKDFGKGYDVSGGKEYYLLADEDALSARQCTLTDEHDKDLADRIREADLKFSQDDLEISDVSLPLTKNKGVYTSITFKEDVAKAKYNCDKGTIYISTFSSGTLQALRWVTMLCGAAGVAILILAAFAKQRKKDSETVSESDADLEEN